jgi:hypothetical protein
VLAVLQNLDSVDEHVDHARRILGRLLERRVIGDLRRIEHHHVTIVSARELASTLNSQIRRWKKSEAPNRFLERNDFLVA